jgi:hypothetical protein
MRFSSGSAAVVRRVLLLLVLLAACSSALFAHAGSVYVPLDSWTYPATERLAALTNTRSEILGLRPWTRLQFASFLERAREAEHSPEAEELQVKLEAEFGPELNAQQEQQQLESNYARTMQIAGQPLRDSYHFGQTIWNDFGRPYGQGFNAISGTSGYLQHRAAFVYVRGEYQHGSGLRSPSAAALTALAKVDEEATVSTVLHQGGPAVDNPRLLDAYVGVSFTRWTATLGKQSLWWGPGMGGAFLASNNAEPFWMGRLTNDRPYKLPLLGRVRIEMNYGKLQGHTYFPGVWFHGEKFSLQPFNSLEINFTRTTQYLGPGRPLSWRRLYRTYFSVDDGPVGNKSANSNADDPGDRRSAVDFNWKLPRIPVTLYSDSFADDEPSPLAQPVRSSFHPGVYIARLPGSLAKLDLRAEGGFTSSQAHSLPPAFNYWNGVYKDGYTNKGLLMGDTIGRASTYFQVWSTYWLSARNKVQVTVRNRYIDPKVITGGGTQSSVRAVANLVVKHDFEVEAGVQAERYNIPLLTGSKQPIHDPSGWAGITYRPEHKVRKD